MPNLRAIKISRRTMRPGYPRTITNLQIVLNTQKILTWIKLPNSKTTCQTFSSAKIPKSKISNRPKNPSIILITWNPQYRLREVRRLYIFYPMNENLITQHLFNRRSGLFFRGSAKFGGQAKGKKEELFPLAWERKKEEGPPNRRLNIF